MLFRQFNASRSAVSGKESFIVHNIDVSVNMLVISVSSLGHHLLGHHKLENDH